MLEISTLGGMYKMRGRTAGGFPGTRAARMEEPGLRPHLPSVCSQRVPGASPAAWLASGERAPRERVMLPGPQLKAEGCDMEEGEASGQECVRAVVKSVPCVKWRLGPLLCFLFPVDSCLRRLPSTLLAVDTLRHT